MDCYLELARHNEPVPEAKKVRDLLARIKASELAAAKQQMKATAALAASFQEAANFIALSITRVKSNQRIIATIETTNKNGGRNTAGCFQGRERAASAITWLITTDLQGGTVNSTLGENAGTQFGRPPCHIGMVSSGLHTLTSTFMHWSELLSYSLY